ncbi:hypothetical protein PIB30_015529 [Stylosanthes scabra]|uniref:Uncharacterized protein n=1 Tax=Stylosanthes scabra TaxID=79078 RepID=A0ABU6Z3N5_9FABA|nr:hypothetical protein [Stylosanthes scabra]
MDIYNLSLSSLGPFLLSKLFLSIFVTADILVPPAPRDVGIPGGPVRSGCNQNTEYGTRVVLLRKRKGKSIFDWGWLQFSLFESSSQVLLGVRDSAPDSHETDKLYRVPAVTGSNLLSPGPQAVVPVVTVANHVRSGHLRISPHSRDTIGLYSLIAEIIKARK